MNRLLARRFVLLLMILVVGCGKQNGEMPVRDPAKEVEAETRRTAQIESFRDADAKRIAAIQHRIATESFTKSKTKWPLSVGFRGGVGSVQKIMLTPDTTRVVVYEYDDA